METSCRNSGDKLEYTAMEAIGPALILLSIPLIFRWVPRNRIYGFRIPPTLANDSVWYDANALSGRHMFALGLMMVLLEFILPAANRAVVLSTIAFVGLAVIIAADWRTANRWLRERERV
jgi:hypothetical protein